MIKAIWKKVSTYFEIAKRLTSKMMLAFVIVLFLYIGIKSMIITSWVPNKVESYLITSEDGRGFEFVILPEHKVLMTYAEDGGFEIVLAQVYWTKGIQYFGPIWKTENGGIFGFHWIDNGLIPMDAEIKILKKRILEGKKSSFPDIGSVQDQPILIGENKLFFSKMWLEKTDLTREESDRFISASLRFLDGKAIERIK
jgi:hypothetical protein